MGKFLDLIQNLFGTKKSGDLRELRAHKRINIQLQATLEQNELSLQVVLMNYSEGGLKFRISDGAKINPSAPVVLVFTTESGEQRVQFEVIWEKEGHYGVKVIDWDAWLLVFATLNS